MKFNFRFKNKVEETMVFFQEKSWAITVFIFLITFISAVVVWKDCVLDPRPSKTALENIENSEKEYQRKMKEIKENNRELESRIERFNNPVSNLEENRNYFKPSEMKIRLKSDYNSEDKDFNPDLIN